MSLGLQKKSRAPAGPRTTGVSSAVIWPDQLIRCSLAVVEE